jgi:hypothetical protein
MNHVLKFAPEKREAILYTRITPENKKFIEALANTEKVSESALVDHIIMLFRTAHAGEQKKS